MLYGVIHRILTRTPSTESKTTVKDQFIVVDIINPIYIVTQLVNGTSIILLLFAINFLVVLFCMCCIQTLTRGNLYEISSQKVVTLLTCNKTISSFLQEEDICRVSKQCANSRITCHQICIDHCHSTTIYYMIISLHVSFRVICKNKEMYWHNQNSVSYIKMNYYDIS